MSEPALRCIAVQTSLEAEEAVGEILFEVFGEASAIWHNLETRESTVSVYPELNQDDLRQKRKSLRKRLGQLIDFGLNPGSLRISARKVKPEDWSESWKRHFKPIEIGHSLLIKPSWSRRKPRAGQAVVILDPGLSFGTGQHPTTSFCLEELVRARNTTRPQSFLDMGTGTGVLAIAAEKLGYHPVVAFDYDAVAVRVAHENATVNRCQVARFAESDLLQLPTRSAEKYDVVCANLIADLLLAARRKIINRVKRTPTRSKNWECRSSVHRWKGSGLRGLSGLTKADRVDTNSQPVKKRTCACGVLIRMSFCVCRRPVVGLNNGFGNRSKMKS